MTTSTDAATEAFEAAWNERHGERERYFRDPLGWVSLTGLYWLTDQFETIGDLPGRWRADADTMYVEGIDGIDTLEPIEGAPGLLVEDGDRRIEVIRRTGLGCVTHPRSEVVTPGGLRRRSHRSSERTLLCLRHVHTV